MKVSVLMITYNHERFIEQAVRSVLDQETTFPWELVIGEDCSTDDTRRVILRLQAEHPDRIRTMMPGSNLGFRRNLGAVLSLCQGEYVALLEGDDYWTSPHKLQAQADYLDAHPRSAVCFHRVAAVYEDGSPADFELPPSGHPEQSTVVDLLHGNFMHTCSVMFRRDVSCKLPIWFYLPVTLADWSLHVLNAQRGTIGYIDSRMAAYRMHRGGVWSSRRNFARARDTAFTLLFLNVHLKFRYWRQSIPYFRDLIFMMRADLRRAVGD